MNLDVSTLPQRLRDAAQAVEDLREAFPKRQLFASPGWLCRQAEEIEAENRAACERDARVQELACMLLEAQRIQDPQRTGLQSWNEASEKLRGNCRFLAQYVIESGWRKGEPNE